jgi:hypothetical protein
MVKWSTRDLLVDENIFTEEVARKERLIEVEYNREWKSRSNFIQAPCGASPAVSD